MNQPVTNKILLQLVANISQKARQTNKIIAVAESCTGGLLSSYLTAISGASEYFDRGFVTYSNQAKAEILGVKAETLQKFGAVSEETAAEMALGCLKSSNAHLAVSITGIAGPTGGDDKKPVGTVCFGIAINSFTKNFTFHFAGNRQQIRLKSCYKALELIADYL